MLLSKLNLSEQKRVDKILCAEKTRRRLNNMGLTEGVLVTLVRIAPFGDPLEIKIRDFYLAIRREIADKITVKST